MAHEIPLSGKDKTKGLILPTEVDCDLAYLLGVLAGDGSMGHRPEKHEYWLKCVGNPKDEQAFYHQIVGPLFQKAFGMRLAMHHFDKETTFGFRTHSRALVTYLTGFIGLPLGRKSDALAVPRCVFAEEGLLISFLRGLFDTDGSMVFKRRYRDYPYYPVISFSSRNGRFTREIARILKKFGFRIVETYDYKVLDPRARGGFTVINRIELNGRGNLERWLEIIGFSSPKHLERIRKYEKSSGGRI